MPLVHPDLTFNRAAIMRLAWAEFRDFGSKYQPFGRWLRKAWALAKAQRAAIADGSAERARRERAERETEQAAFFASLTPSRLAAIDEAIAIQCATDGRLSAAARARLDQLAGARGRPAARAAPRPEKAPA